MRKIALVLMLALPAVAGAAVVTLVDQLSIADQQTYVNANGNWLDGRNLFGSPSDLQLADDFTVPGVAHYARQVTFDYLMLSGQTIPSGGALVEFFAEAGNCLPNEAPFASVTVPTNLLTKTNWTDTVFGGYGCIRLTADLSSYNIVLPAGKVWVAMQGIDPNNWGYTPRGTPVAGCQAVLRDAGVDHGNGYMGGYGTNNWAACGNYYPPAGDLSIKVTGEPVPEPASLALLGLAALVLRRR